MSVEDITASSRDRSVKTLAIRLEPEQHATLSLIAQLRGSTITDEIRNALLTHIESIKTQPELAAKAGDVLEAIEREAATRRDAIASLFGTTPDQVVKTPGPSPTDAATTSGTDPGTAASTTRKTRSRSDT